MTRKVLARAVQSLVVVWLVLTVTFAVFHALPADPARAIAGPQARPADVERIREKLGLNRPITSQYWLYLRRLVHFGPAHIPPKDPDHRSCVAISRVHLDLGMSFQKRQPVAKLVGDRLPRSLLLAVSAVALQAIVGIVVGVFAALRRGRWLDHASIALTLLGISMPTFVTGLVLQYWLAYRLRWLPLDGWGQTVTEHARCLVLPAMTLGMLGASFYARFVRDEMITQLHSEYVRTAASKGISRWRVVGLHALRNAAMPLLTVIGMDLGALIGGAIVTEKLFRWPGLGALSVDAVVERDAPVVMAVVLIASVSVVLCNLIVDALYGVIDPRTRVG